MLLQEQHATFRASGKIMLEPTYMGDRGLYFLGGKKSKAKQSNAVVTCSRLLPTSAQINLECCGKHSVAYPLHGLLALVCLLAASTQDSKVTADFRLVYNLHTLCLLWEA